MGPEGGRPGRPTQTVRQFRKFRNAFKFKIAPHEQKSIVKKYFGRKMPPPLANLSTMIN